MKKQLLISLLCVSVVCSTNPKGFSDATAAKIENGAAVFMALLPGYLAIKSVCELKKEHNKHGIRKAIVRNKMLTLTGLVAGICSGFLMYVGFSGTASK